MPSEVRTALANMSGLLPMIRRKRTPLATGDGTAVCPVCGAVKAAAAVPTAQPSESRAGREELPNKSSDAKSSSALEA